MVTNKAFTIRLGQTQTWSSSLAAQNWYQYHFNLKLKSFFEKFFGDKFFQNRGISFSHIIPRFFADHANLEVFLHDSKLYDFFSTKPSRRALKVVRSRRKLGQLFKKFAKFKLFVRKKRKIKKYGIKFKKFKKGTQSRFAVSSGFRKNFRRRFFQVTAIRLAHTAVRVARLNQTLESKFKKNIYFKSRFKSVRKFVKSARKLTRRFTRNKLKLFRPIKLKKSDRNFVNSKFNFILNRRKHLSSLFIIKKRFKRKKFKKKYFKKFFKPHRRGFRFRKLFFKKKQFRKKKKITRISVKRAYSRRLIRITRKFSSRFYLKLKRTKINFLKFYLQKIKSSALDSDKLASSLRAYYFRKKYAIFNNLRNKKFLNSKKLRKSKLGRKFFRMYSFRPKAKKNKLFGKNKKKHLKLPKSRVNTRRSFSKQRFSHPKFGRKFSIYKSANFKKKFKKFRYPTWRIRYLPINENGKKAAKFIFFGPSSAYASSRFIRYNFYHFLAKFLSAQVFRKLKLPVFVKFNFFPLHRAGSDFYLNFITTKLYYRYILSDVIKPIVRMSLKFYRGFVINCNGRFTRAQMAVSKKFVRKSVSYSKITSSLDYAQKNVVLKYGTCNLRIWIRK